MLSPEIRRLSEAQKAVHETFIDPITKLISASADAVRVAEQRARRAETVLEELRPVWAQGYSSDSQAAQATGNALAEIWSLLGVDNQTSAMQRLKELLP